MVSFFGLSDIRAAARILCVDHLGAGDTQPAVRSVARGPQALIPAGVECEPPSLTQRGSTHSLKASRLVAAIGGVRL